MSEMGRPKKLKDGRSAVTVYLDTGIRRAVDERVFREKLENPSYSRSDFLNEAVEFYLAALEEGEVQNGEQQTGQV